MVVQYCFEMAFLDGHRRQTVGQMLKDEANLSWTARLLCIHYIIHRDAEDNHQNKQIAQTSSKYVWGRRMH